MFGRGVLILAGVVGLALVGCGEPRGTADLLGFIADGVTTRAEVLARFGAPSGRFDADAIFSYWVDRDSGGWFVAVRHREGMAQTDYSLVLVFAADGRLLAHALVRVRGGP